MDAFEILVIILAIALLVVSVYSIISFVLSWEDDDDTNKNNKIN